MTAISGTRRQFKEMADGSIRVSVDIDPAFRDEFFRLFSAIDMPVALAPLVADFEKPATIVKQEIDKPKGGELAKLAGMWCRDPEFQAWFLVPAELIIYNPKNGIPSTPEAACAQKIKNVCRIESRAELDSNPMAAALFNDFIRVPFMERKK